MVLGLMKTSSSQRFLMIRGAEVIEAAKVHDVREITLCVNYKEFLIF